MSTSPPPVVRLRLCSTVHSKPAQRPFVAESGVARSIQRHMARVVAQEPLATAEYLAVCDPLTLEPLSTLHRKAVLLGALRIGKVRLLDNMLVSVPASPKPVAMLVRNRPLAVELKERGRFKPTESGCKKARLGADAGSGLLIGEEFENQLAHTLLIFRLKFQKLHPDRERLNRGNHSRIDS